MSDCRVPMPDYSRSWDKEFDVPRICDTCIWAAWRRINDKNGACMGIIHYDVQQVRYTGIKRTSTCPEWQYYKDPVALADQWADEPAAALATNDDPLCQKTAKISAVDSIVSDIENRLQPGFRSGLSLLA